jgi:hypothetical protein
VEHALTYLYALPDLPPRQDTRDERAGAAVQGREAENDGGVLPNEASASTSATENMLRSNEEWTLRCYLSMEALETVEKSNPQRSRR